MTYHAYVTEGGELVLPADLARAFGLQPGDDIEVESDGSATGLRLLTTRGQSPRVRDEVDRFVAERADDWRD